MELKFATLNLYQYLLPGLFWYERDDDNKNSDASWAAKQAWISDMLRQLDADVVGFQEVFSIEPFAELVKAAGYPHLAIVAEPAQDEDDSEVFVGPVVAIASRHPFVEPPTPMSTDERLAADTVLEAGFRPRRDIVQAKIDLPGLGPTTVFCCHFKSQGAFVDKDAVAALPGWRERFRDHMRQRVVKDADQLMRRSAEAAAVYLAAMEEVEKDREAPVVVLGDLNDTPDSPTLRIITQGDWISTIGGRQRGSLEAADKAWQFTWQLFDAFGLTPQQRSGWRQPTHKASYFYPPSTLDYVLVSNGLNGSNPRASWHVKRLKILGNHLITGGDDRTSSDHAAVLAIVEPKERATG
ncbi:MAG: endonuclease/exonuclease/phosphatase family protein [Pseudomonadota bacterium]